MAKTNKRNFSTPSLQGSKIIFKQWDEYKSGFENDETLMRSQCLSEEKSPIIAWSSDSECSSDSESTPDVLNTSRIHRIQNHQVVTRLNFDDCVTRQCEVPNKKRAKISRSVLKTNLFRNKRTSESNCKNELVKNCKLSEKVHIAHKIGEKVSSNTICSSFIFTEENVLSFEHNVSINTSPKGGMDVDSHSCLVSKTSFEEIKPSQLLEGISNPNYTPVIPNLELPKIGNKSSVPPNSPILCNTQLAERIQKSPIIGSSQLKRKIVSPILETYSVKKSRRKHKTKENIPSSSLDTLPILSHELSNNSLPQKHTNIVEEELVLECINNSGINTELYFQTCNRDGNFAPTSPIIDTTNKRLKINRRKKEYRGQKNCLGPDFEVKVLEKKNKKKLSADTVSPDISKIFAKNCVSYEKDPGVVKNYNKSKQNSNFEKLNLFFDQSSLICMETDSQNVDSRNISVTQTSESSTVIHSLCTKTTKGYLIQDDEVCNISTFSGESKMSDIEPLNHIDITKTGEMNKGRQQKCRKKSFICQTYQNCNPVSNSDMIQSPDESVTECIETIFSQESINEKVEDIDEDISASTSISQTSKSSTDVGIKEYGITVDSKSPERQENVLSAHPMNLDSPRRMKRLKKDGLAARLNKLLSRKLSVIRMLNHEISRQDTNTKIRKAKCILCTVIFTWAEFNRMLVYCQLMPSTDSLPNETTTLLETGRWNGTLWKFDGECSKINIVLVFNIDMYRFGQIKQGSVIKLFPPWQTFISSKQNLSIIFDIAHLEIVSTGPLQEYSSNNSKKYHYISEHEQTFSCQCDSDLDSTCQLKLSSNIMKIFFPNQSSNEQTNTILSSMKDVGEKCDYSVVLAAKKNMLLPHGDITLVLTIVKIFNYREQISKNSDPVEIWSILGKDDAGEYCEVILGSTPDIPSKAKLFNATKWQDIIQSGVVGSTYKFSGFSMINRKHRNKVPELWSLLQKTKVINRTCSEEADVLVFSPNVNNVFLYIFAPSTDNWNCECVKEASNSFSESLENLAFSIQEINEAEIHRFSAFVKLLHMSNIYIYVSGTSTTNEIVTYFMISIHPFCVLPSEILHKKTDFLVLVDAIGFNGQLTTDKYSRIYSVVSNADVQMTLLSVKALNYMKHQTNKMQKVVGNITNSSNENDLVLVEGTVVGVDEETAFAWPACTTCNSDSLSELDDGSLFCNFCNQETEIFTKMSLEIFVCCKDVSPNTLVKIKLLQKTISYLLPPKSNNEGYEMSSILGKKVNLPLCLVVTVKHEESIKSVFLEEI